MHSKRVIRAARRVEAEYDNREVAALASSLEWSHSQKMSDAMWRDDCQRKLLEFRDAYVVAQAVLKEIG